MRGMPVINKIKPFLDGRGITPYRFQKDVGIAVRTAYDLYNLATQLPSSSVLSKICDAYRVQPGELLEWVESPEGVDTVGS
jgi:DNA-binding Xre family transcriptional regulator